MPKTDWSGIVLTELLALAAPRPEARFVCVCAGPYATPIALADADHVLLCDRLADGELPLEADGPWRLVVPGTRYYTSVKWVELLEVTADPPDNSAERIAQARARASAS